MSLLRVFVLTVFLVHLMKGEIYTSVQDLTKIFNVERNVVDALAAYVVKTEARIKTIRRYLQEYEQVRLDARVTEAGSVTEDDVGERLAGNPLQAYHLLKRLTLDWKDIEDHDPNTDWGVVEQEILKGQIFGFSDLRNEEDLKGAAQALIRLQNIYQLNTTSLVRGNVWGIQSAAELSAEDCIYLGKNAFNLGTYYNAMEWFEQAYVLAGQERNKTVTQEEAQRYLTSAVQEFEASQRRSLEQQEQKNSVKDSNLEPQLFSKMAELSNFRKEIQLGKDITEENILHNFASLCRGEQLMDDAYKATLKCYFDRRGSPFLTLMPAKVEKHHHHPEILIFHDAIRERDISLIKTFSKTQLSRSTVQSFDENLNTVSTMRTSKTAWMDREVEMSVFRSLNLYMSYLTGLRTNCLDFSAEPLQTANYGTGGHYNPHCDYLLDNKTEQEIIKVYGPMELLQGDRIATLMFYLSDVTRGGATAFPKMGVSLFPQKGSAAFWYNLKKSGKGEELTLHGGCPVVHGSKWVCNKWIRERTQFLQRPCGLKAEE